MNIVEYYCNNDNINQIKEDLKITNNVFVYGTLKKGYGNNSLLKNSKFIDTAISTENTFQTYCNGGFPMTIDTFKYNNCKISGELYQITDINTMIDLDMLESNGNLYTRDIREFVCENTKQKTSAWIYLYNRNPEELGKINLNIKFFIDMDGKRVIEWKRELGNYNKQF